MIPRATDVITLVTLADERYAVPLAVMGRSLSETTRSDRPLVLTVVDGGITRETKEHLVASWNRDRLRVEFVPPQYGGERALPVWGRLPALTWVRVFLPALVPADCHRAIFLDSDVLIRRDIGQLWDEDLGGRHLLAVQDPAIPFVSSRDGLARYEALGIPARQPFFNAGVMVADIDRWRRSHVTERVMEFVHQNANELNYCDQDGLNAILWNEWAALDPRWQVQPRFTTRGLPLPHLDAAQRAQLTADPWIFHFSGRLKPWIYRGATLPDRIFYEYLDRTWWAGWRPRVSVKAEMYRVYDSTLRRWCYPLEQRGQALLRRIGRHSVAVNLPVSSASGARRRGPS